MTKPENKDQVAGSGWWIAWGICFLVSLLPPCVHHWTNIAGVIEPLRYHTGLLPFELLSLRHFGEVSRFIPFFLILLLIGAIMNMKLKKRLISIGALLVAVFSTFYATFCIFLLSLYLGWYAENLREQVPAEQKPAGSFPKVAPEE